MATKVEAVDFRGCAAFRLEGPRGAAAVVARRGGQVLSWTTGDGRERLFLSPRARFDGSLPIRGGIPVCFPQFAGRGSLPKHGLVRNVLWEAAETRATEEFALLTLACGDDVASRHLWPHGFRAEITVVLEADRLDVELAVDNSGATPWAFTAALHSYLRVVQVEDIALEGLRGSAYEDCVAGEQRREKALDLVVEAEVDRIYREVTRPLLLRAGNLSLGIHGQGFPDVVVWNPWVEKCAALPDMAPDSWRHMLCVEAAAVQRPVALAPGESWAGRQTLVAL